MKIFQIFKGFCHWDATYKHPTLKSTEGLYTSDIIFVEAPDYVFEGWGFNEDAEDEARFIQPTPPEGWVYDEKTGTFYPSDSIIQDEEAIKARQEARIIELETELAILKAKLNS